ncbi:MAG: tRNA (guanine(46)-N(7))-methyltransferase TrmB [Pseudobdellovibrio sp.]
MEEKNNADKITETVDNLETSFALASENKKNKDDYFKYTKTIPRPEINRTSTLPIQTEYSLALENEYKDFAFSEERAPLNKGKWRKSVFKVDESHPMDLEIGTGAGMHFAYHTQKFPERCLVGLELKYKPLIQSIRRARMSGAQNSAICRFHAFNLDLLFEANEVDNVFIHFPDPWTSPRKPKNRVVNRIILKWIYDMQRVGSFLEFKTDSREYFLWALEEMKETPYKIEFKTLDLYSENNQYKENNFPTTFEKIFVRQGIQINYIKLIKS